MTPANQPHGAGVEKSLRWTAGTTPRLGKPGLQQSTPA